MANICILHIQGFTVNKEFIAKEVAVVHGKEEKYAHYVFMPPKNTYPDVNNRLFLENCFHGLNWNCGYIPYTNLKRVLYEATHNFTEIYVKGHNKVMFVNKLLNKKVVNLEAFGFPKLTQLKTSNEFNTYSLKNNNVKYFYHKCDSCTCALLNALMLTHWFRRNIELL